MEPAGLPRKLGLLDSISIVVGVMIGSAIFIVPSAVAQNLPAAEWILAAWTLAGLLSFFGALAFAELGAMMPLTGGQYVYLREAFGPLCAFLYGWALFLVIRSGGTATLAVAFSIYLAHFVPLTPALAKLASVALIATLTFVNYRGVKGGARVQNLFTVLKVLGLALLIASALAARQPPAWQGTSGLAGFTWTGFATALVACLWACQGWFTISWVAGEIRRPERNIVLALGLGVGFVTAVYLLANVAYLRVLSIPEIAASERVAASMAQRTIGSLGAGLVSLTILASIVGATNGGLLGGPRVYFAQARDGLFFERFGRVHPRFQTPSFSIFGQGLWAAVLAVSGSYQKLYSYVIFASWIFYGLTAAGVLILRRKRPEAARPYRMWGYPVTPLLFVAISLLIVAGTLAASPGPSAWGLLIIASGVPLYYYWRGKHRTASAAGD